MPQWKWMPCQELYRHLCSYKSSDLNELTTWTHLWWRTRDGEHTTPWSIWAHHPPVYCHGWRTQMDGGDNLNHPRHQTSTDAKLTWSHRRLHQSLSSRRKFNSYVRRRGLTEISMKMRLSNWRMSLLPWCWKSLLGWSTRLLITWLQPV